MQVAQIFPNSFTKKLQKMFFFQVSFVFFARCDQRNIRTRGILGKYALSIIIVVEKKNNIQKKVITKNFLIKKILFVFLLLKNYFCCQAKGK